MPESLFLIKVFSCEFWEIFKSTDFYRKPPVAASGKGRIRIPVPLSLEISCQFRLRFR